jgi:mono/diheme cytochrome c family protein
MTTINKFFILPALLFCSVSLFAQAKKPVAKPHTVGLAASMANGKLIYGKICITCHMADAGGVPNMNPPLTHSEYVNGNKAKLVSILVNGLNENIEVDGSNYSNVMPAQEILKDQEIADVLTYVRRSFGNKGTAVTLADVKKARATKK